MSHNNLHVIKYSGKKAKFSLEKLKKSLTYTGADKDTINEIVVKVKQELYEGISTREIYNRAYNLLKRKQSVYASKYKLKKAIFELGPTGFPFENFIGAILKYSGYKIALRELIQGRCVLHEVDILARKNSNAIVVECKFHSDQARKSNVKVPLYIHSRYGDIKENWKAYKSDIKLIKGWVVTNTRFTSDATSYGKCVGLYLLSWDYPAEDSLKERINRLGLYPLTTSSLLTKREKQFLLDKDIVLCRELLKHIVLLDHLGIALSRQKRIINEMKNLCKL